MEQSPDEKEEITRAQKLKIAAGGDVVAAGAAVEIVGISNENNYLLYGGLAGVAAGAIYALRSFPESSQAFLSEYFHIPRLRNK